MLIIFKPAFEVREQREWSAQGDHLERKRGCLSPKKENQGYSELSLTIMLPLMLLKKQKLRVQHRPTKSGSHLARTSGDPRLRNVWEALLCSSFPSGVPKSASPGNALEMQLLIPLQTYWIRNPGCGTCQLWLGDSIAHMFENHWLKIWVTFLQMRKDTARARAWENSDRLLRNQEWQECTVYIGDK